MGSDCKYQFSRHITFQNTDDCSRMSDNVEILPCWYKLLNYRKDSDHSCRIGLNMLGQCTGRHMRKNKTEQLKRYLHPYIFLSFDTGSGCKCFLVLNKWNLYEERHIRKGKNPVRLTCSCTLLNSGRGSVYKCQFDHRSLYLYKGRRSCIGTTDCCFYDCTRRHFDMDSDCKYQFSHRIVSHRKDGCSRT